MRKKVRRISCVFEKRRLALNLLRVVQGLHHHDRGHCHRLQQGSPFHPAGPFSSTSGTAIGSPCGTSSSDETSTRGAGTSSSSGATTIVGLCGTGTPSSSNVTVAVSSYDSENPSSIMRMCFVLGTSSSSYITCVANWSGETGSSQRQRLDSLDGAMARV
jgi:hypothetical protein